ncbi:protein of unknown function DUF1549 [Pedosphaera parvula Ellin514]|uniref:LamG-like jellyroll fold domain-containing protein n=2 Tax=Pedosphaera TaxID=1032526 RepID=B9XQ67_PEDPL|nr:protein of unknown function DUF1549 [Pedosphaera parvula Ellin514]
MFNNWIMTPVFKFGFMTPLSTKLFLALLGTLVASQVNAAPAPDKIEYNRDIRPILSENCFGCHGPDSASRKAGLRLDKLDEATAPRKENKFAIVPGSPEKSELVRRITASDPDDIMPPAKTHKTLSSKEKDLLKLWIAGGAKYQAHWSFLAPTRPELPKVKNRRWVHNPIDQFLLARLEKEGLKPASEADRRTLARRVTLDLTGLPPKPEDVEVFLKDTSANAYEKLVDRLLASPQYGEHRARYWLDTARYADSNGIHFDNYREIWSYRDWIIKAFNRNLSFDKFTIDQLAGDLLPGHDLDDDVATGFNRCNMTTNEGGAIDDEYYVLYARDRTEATGQTWLGLTVGCAVCHDHKFDPLSQKEFYSLSAFFNNTTQKAMDGNVQNTPPILVVPLEQDRAKWESLSPRIDAAKAKLDDRRKVARPDFDIWFTNVSAKAFSKRLPKDVPQFRALLADNKTNSIQVAVNGENRTVTLATNAHWQGGYTAAKAYTSDAKTTPALDDVGDFDKDQSFSYGAWVYLAKGRDGAVIARMDDQHDYRGWDLWLEGGKPGTHIVSKWPEDALKVVANKAIDAKRWTHVCITYDGSAKASGVKIYMDGELQESVGVQADKLQNTLRTKVPFKIGQRNTSSPLDTAGIQDVRIYNRVLKPTEVKSLATDTRMAYLVTRLKKKENDKEKDELYTGYLKDFDQPYQDLSKSVAEVERQGADIKARATVAHVMHEKPESPEAFVLFRGEYDKRRDKVEPTTPKALPAMPADFPRNRLGFAKWLLLPEHPLTARVNVNRFWQELFGVGIVRTTGDFGITGELPSNQALLDWLAVEFRESGWDMKHMYKLMVMSSSYRQAATVTPEKLSKDPDNRLLSRGPRFRMDGEMVRDYALSASGLLIPKIGGPSVKPYQPDGVWEAVAMIGSNTRDYKRDSGEALYRRSLYTFWKRAAPPASMEIFNAPSRETCTVRRERTDTPLQALVTMDDPQFIEAARNLAQHALKDCGARDEVRIDFIAQRLLARPLKPAELKIVSSGYKGLLAHYQSTPKAAEALVSVGESKPDPSLDRPTLAAYTMVANQLMNLDEVLNK